MRRVRGSVEHVKLPSPVYSLYENRLRASLDSERMPRHVAVMCDGNRRWAKEAGFTDVSHGHRAGAVKVAELLQWCDDLGIEIATIYLLSVENLERDASELDLLLDIIGDVVEEISRSNSNWRVGVVGHTWLLPEPLAARLQAAQDSSKDNTGTLVNVAVGYGGRQEITDAARDLVAELVADGKSGEELIEGITVDGIGEHLYTKGQPDPDLVIRTSGEQRLSGFLLWQSAYSEIWFTEAYWPAFRKVDFLRAIRDFGQRNRRFGK
ncbi:Isoprenyl transferase 1 [Dietzia timorensis]|uniref:Isoprenyl transferase n=1 Tax=Dietzia timorensis TaxID=499555 RepID=A0A173LQH7_9ACTN|nr:Isoprenyl transferase 1 [Dietzia timorensis]